MTYLSPEEELVSIKARLTEFFSFLDATEESDSGRVFHPIAISCCRAMQLEPLGKCITALRSHI